MLVNHYIHDSGDVQDPNDVFPLGNAASFNDVDSLGTWTNFLSGIAASLFVSGRDYVIQITSNDTIASQGAFIQATIEAGETYDVTYDYRVTNYVSSTQATRAWLGFTTAPLFEFETDGTWRTHTEPGLVANSTFCTLRFYSTRIAAAGANVIEIDNVTVIKQ